MSPGLELASSSSLQWDYESDFWAIGQLFPIMPIHRLNERPTVCAVLTDLTCDSDGKVDTFIGNDDDGKHGLALHSFEERSEPYYL